MTAAGHLYRGWVRHRRQAPTTHEFRYPLCFVGLDLQRGAATLDALPWAGWQRPAWARFHRADYHGNPHQHLDTSIRELVRERTGQWFSGSIELITHLRQGGHCFNPVSFYRCRDTQGELRYWVVEITNTPWNQRHCYVLDVADSITTGTGQRFVFGKNFHVSPFMPMDQTYDWTFHDNGRQLTVHMVTRADDRIVFDATFAGQVEPLSASRFRRAMIRYPLQTVQVISRIYWQALRLWWKRTPFHPHPDTSQGAAS